MNKSDYAKQRYPLEKERLDLLNLLESQGDFPDQKLVQALEDNKTKILNLDAGYSYLWVKAKGA
jgi:hypothetical protein